MDYHHWSLSSPLQDAVRRRPGMYFGGVDHLALHRMLNELLRIPINEAVDGNCSLLVITLRPDNIVSIEDNSEGLPVEADESLGLPILELLFTHVSHYHPFLKRYVVSGGGFGVGLAACNAACEWMRVEATQDGFWWGQSYDAGFPRVPVTRDRQLYDGEHTGRKITFKPDLTIFSAIPNNSLIYDADAIARRCHKVAYQIPELTIILRDERNQEASETKFHEPEGLRGLIKSLCPPNSHPLHDCIHASLELAKRKAKYMPAYTFTVEFAIQFTTAEESTDLGYSNTVQTTHGGTHMAALYSGLVSGINKYLPSDSKSFRRDDLPRGLLTVISIQHPDPQFERQTVIKLLNEDVYNPIKRVVTSTLDAFAAAHPNQMQRIIEHCIANRSRRTSQ